jgi:hypothetical protein
MAQQLSPWLEGAYGWNFGESNWNTGIDQNQLKFSFMFDRNVDSIVAFLPAAVNGQAHYLTTDNRLYFAVGTTYFSTPVPKWFTVVVRATGQYHQFNGTSLVQVDTPAQIETRLDAVEVTVASLGTAAFEDIGFFATQADLDIAEADAAAYTDDLRADIAATGAALVGFQQLGTGAVPRTVDLKLNEVVTSTDFGTVDQAALAAYNAGKPLMLLSGESGKLICNPTSGDDIQAMCKWFGTCLLAPDSTFYIEITDWHTVSTFIDINNGDGPMVDIRSPGITFIQITDVAFAPVAGDLYTATITIDTALPASVVPDCCVGTQNMQGTNDIGALNGAQIVKTIAGDRLSFTCEFLSPSTPTTGVLDNTLTLGLTANQIVVYQGGLIAQSTGWDGSSREGFINCLHGGKMQMRNIGIAYSGATATEHDLIFTRGAGSRFYCFDRVGLAGAGDKVLRSFADAEMYLNRSCVGGGGTAAEIFQGGSGGNNVFIRCSMGGAITSGITAGATCGVALSSCPIGACGTGFRTVSAGASIIAYPTVTTKCNIGILATIGTIHCDSTTEVERCVTGVSWGAGGVVIGNITFGTAGQANTTDFVAPGNTWYQGGIWYKDTGVNSNFDSLSVVADIPELTLKDAANTVTIGGDAGNLQLKTTSVNRDIQFKTSTSDIGQIDGTDGHHYSQAIRLGVNVISTTRPFWTTVTGTPEGVVTAPVGSMVTRTDGGATTTLYVKESGAGNTGWVAK